MPAHRAAAASGCKQRPEHLTGAGAGIAGRFRLLFGKSPPMAHHRRICRRNRHTVQAGGFGRTRIPVNGARVFDSLGKHRDRAALDHHLRTACRLSDDTAIDRHESSFPFSFAPTIRRRRP